MQAHKNNVGLLRLLLASLVIVGHAPEQIDGDRLREPLTAIFHTLSLGELAVDGFFLLSGYLITMSMIKNRSLMTYLSRRVLRIYPAFVVAFLLCVFVLAPMVGGDPRVALLRTFVRMAILQDPPAFPGQLAGLPYPALNGSMWTIAYEFRCYLLVALLGVTGLLSRRWAILALTSLAMLGLIAETFAPVHAWSDAFDVRWRTTVVIGAVAETIRLTAVFLVGACFYLFRDEILPRLDGRAAAVCAAATIPLLFLPHLAEAALATLGAIALFWLAFRANIGPIQRINDSWDVSYGVYLYGWPIAIALLWFNRGVSPWALVAMTLPLALMFGAASWWGLERWTKDLGRYQSAARSKV